MLNSNQELRKIYGKKKNLKIILKKIYLKKFKKVLLRVKHINQSDIKYTFILFFINFYNINKYEIEN